MVRHAPIHRRSGHSDIAICCGRNVRGSSPSTSVVPLSNQVTTLNHKRFKGFKMFSDGHSDLQISDGAQIEGSVIAQNVIVCGRVKGTIRAVRVKLQNGGAVEGDIFHRSLSIDENSQFEGSSRRVENPTEIPSSIDAK